MTKLKLEVHLQILKEVAIHDEVDFGKVAFYTQIAIDDVERSLVFLSVQGLVERNQKGLFMITRRGLAVLKHFGVLELKPQAIENY